MAPPLAQLACSSEALAPPPDYISQQATRRRRRNSSRRAPRREEAERVRGRRDPSSLPPRPFFVAAALPPPPPPPPPLPLSERSRRGRSCRSLRPPCPPRRRCGPCWTSSWARPGTVSRGGRPGGGWGGSEARPPGGLRRGAATVCACAGVLPSPARRPGAPGLCLSSSRRLGPRRAPPSEPASSVGCQPPPRRPSCDFSAPTPPPRPPPPLEPGVGEGLQPAWAQGAGSGLAELLRAREPDGLETPAVFVLYRCRGSRKLSFSNVGSCRVLFQPPFPLVTQDSLCLASAWQSLGRLYCREERKILMVVSGGSGCIFAKLYTCCGLCFLFYRSKEVVSSHWHIRRAVQIVCTLFHRRISAF